MNPRHRLLAARALVSLIFVGVGVVHFVTPERFTSIMPPYIPYPFTLVYVSGVFEVLGGLGVWAPWPRVRRAAGLGLVALLVSVFIVNIDMALVGSPMRNGMHVPGGSIALWLRLPLQFVMMWLAIHVTREDPPAASTADESAS